MNTRQKAKLILGVIATVLITLNAGTPASKAMIIALLWILVITAVWLRRDRP